MSEHVLIWGATPLAGWLAAAFHAKFTTTWLTDPATHTALAAEGLRIGESVFRDLNVITDMADARPPDVILLAAPSWYNATAIRILSNGLRPAQSPPPIVVLQLGMGGVQQIESAFGAEHALLGVATRPLDYAETADGQLDRARLVVGQGGGIALQAGHRLSQKVAALMRAVGLKVILGEQAALQWSSVLWGIQTNALAAVLNLSPAQIYDDPTWFAYEHCQLVEALSIIRRLGVRLLRLPGVNVPLLARGLGGLPPHWARPFLRRFPRPPALKHDLALKTGRSDAAYLNGAVALQAHQLGLRAPVNHVLALTVTDIAEGRGLWSYYQQHPKVLEAALRLAIG